MFRYLEDQILAFLQRRCDHPGNMVAVDILEGCGPGIEVKHCRRCGAVKIIWTPKDQSGKTHETYKSHEGAWRLPDPNLWRD